MAVILTLKRIVKKSKNLVEEWYLFLRLVAKGLPIGQVEKMAATQIKKLNYKKNHGALETNL